MRVTFATNTLEKCFQDHKAAQRRFGQDVARKYIQRITILQTVRDLDELVRLPRLHCHRLQGKRKDQWAVTLIGRYRLIFTLTGEELNIVRIQEVSKHYGD